MSFGFGIGDIIAVSTLARKVWGRFRDSSDQFNSIQSEVAGLYLILDDIATSLSGIEVTDKQAKDLPILLKGCRDALDDAEKYIRRNESLGTDSTGLGSKTQKAWRKLKWDPTTINQLRDRMVANTSYLNAFNNNLASQTSRATNDTIKLVAEDIQKLRLNQSQTEREEILQWISPLNFASQQSDLYGRRQEGTGSWFLESKKFQEWKNMGGSTLICQGMPGAGKTMLASLVIDYLERNPGEEIPATTYIYCDYRRQDEQTPINLTASVTRQLLQHQFSIPEDVLKIYNHHKSKSTRPGFDEVLELLKYSMARLTRVYLIVDALDELGNVGQVRQNFIGRLRFLQDLYHFNLMTTSRYIPSLAQDLQNSLCIEIRASPNDIRKYVQGHISDLAKCVRRDSGLQETIADSIANVVEGMFLLAQLHMDSLRDKTSIKSVKKALETLPEGVNGLDLAYDGALRRIESQKDGFRFLAKRLLGWLTYSKRLMTITEVQHALAIEPDTSDLDEENLSDLDEIVSFCAGLVIVDEETQIIRLVHYTTQEYLARNGDTILPSAQQDIAVSCLTYLLYDELGDGWLGGKRVDQLYTTSIENRLQRHPFLDYAARYWATHAGVCGQRNIKEIMMRFARDDFRVSTASQVILILDKRRGLVRHIHITRTRCPLSAMHLIAYLGDEHAISELLNQGFELNALDAMQRTPLWWAAMQGHQAVVDLLLSQKNVNVNSRGVRNGGANDQIHTETSLGVAAYEGKVEIVERLIKREDVDVNLPDGDNISPLVSAAEGGHSAVTGLLLTRKDIDVNSRNHLGRTVLWYAANYGQENIVRQLLNIKDTQVNCTDNKGRSILAAAAHQGHAGAVKLLLGRADIDVNASDRHGHAPILNAIYERHEAVVEVLLSHPNIEVNCKDSTGRAAIHYAVIYKSISIVKLLIHRIDVDVNMKDNLGETALHKAAKRGYAPAVKLLSAHPDVDLNLTNNEGRDVLALVSEEQKMSSEWGESIQNLEKEWEECLEILRAAIEKRSQEKSRVMREEEA